MSAKILFFPVGNGDMTLIELETGQQILMDMRIRAAAEDASDSTPDVTAELRKRLRTDGLGRAFVDVLILTHLHEDHCLGLQRHFHLGPPSDYQASDNKILIQEIWCGAAAFMEWDGLVDDAKAAVQEVQRRAQRTGGDWDRLRILGDGEVPDGVAHLAVPAGSKITSVGDNVAAMEVLVLGPLPPAEDESDEDLISMHRWSLVLRFELEVDGHLGAGLLLSGGDAEVAVWERLWEAYEPESFKYHLLQAPHHCSWRSMSYDSWSDMGEAARVCKDALSALSQGLKGAHIIASSKPIADADSDPPSTRAKREYLAVTQSTGGRFLCVMEEPSERWPDVMEFTVEWSGPRYTSGRRARTSGSMAGGLIGSEPLSHG